MSWISSTVSSESRYYDGFSTPLDTLGALCNGNGGSWTLDPP